MKIKADQIRTLRDATGAPVMRAKKVLEELNGNIKKAEEVLKKEGFEKVEKRQGRQTLEGKIICYQHHSGKVAGMIELLCETDFVARNELFTKLGYDLAMQVASMNPKDTSELLEQEFIKEPSKKVSDLVKEVIAKTGENIQIGRFYRLEIGK
jgi:elongation factor Ts